MGLCNIIVRSLDTELDETRRDVRRVEYSDQTDVPIIMATIFSAGLVFVV